MQRQGRAPRSAAKNNEYQAKNKGRDTHRRGGPAVSPWAPIRGAPTTRRAVRSQRPNKNPARSPARAHQLIFNFTNNLICRVVSTMACAPYASLGAPRALRRMRKHFRDHDVLNVEFHCGPSRVWLIRSTSGARPFRRPEISLSQGAEWKALISKYIGSIPLSGDAFCAAEQSVSGGPSPTTPVSSAMVAKVGAAARHSQSAAPRAAAVRLS